MARTEILLKACSDQVMFIPAEMLYDLLGFLIIKGRPGISLFTYNGDISGIYGLLSVITFLIQIGFIKLLTNNKRKTNKTDKLYT